MFSIEEFKSTVKHGFVMNNKYQVIFSVPMGMSGNATAPKMIAVNCVSVNIPGMSFATEDIKLINIRQKLAYEPIYSPLRITVRCSANMEERKFFDSWSETIFNIENDFFNFPDNYTSDAELYIYNNSGEGVYEIDLYEIYPTAIGDINMTYEGGEIATFDVEFFHTQHLTYNS